VKIPITKPVIDESDREIILKPLQTGWLVQGGYVEQFEKLFSEYTGSKYAVATSSCTTALHLALIALGISNRDKVIVPSFTFIASANAVEYTGSEVVFCDINLKTFNIDEKKIEEIIEKDKKITAIMPVNLFGLCANLPQIVSIAKRYGIKVIEDSACGFDSWIGSMHSGRFGDAGCFSFHPRKVITTGEGGMLITEDEMITKSVRALRNHGAGKSDLERHIEASGSLLPEYNVLGYNYRMTDIQASLGVSQMKKAKRIVEGRKRIANFYYNALKDASELVLPFIPEGYTHSFQSFVCLFTKGEDLSTLNKNKIDRLNLARNRFMNKLSEKGISTRQGTHAVHTLGYYKKKYRTKDEDYLISYAADRLSVTLPLYEMTDTEFDYVIENIKKALRD